MSLRTHKTLSNKANGCASSFEIHRNGGINTSIPAKI